MALLITAKAFDPSEDLWASERNTSPKSGPA